MTTLNIERPAEKIVLAEPRHIKDPRYTQINLKKSAPFYLNHYGVLAHRVESAFILHWDKIKNTPWLCVKYLCGSGTSNGDITNFSFDMGGRFMCERCEMVAVTKELPSSSELAGHHVCTGKARPVNTCKIHGAKHD